MKSYTPKDLSPTHDASFASEGEIRRQIKARALDRQASRQGAGVGGVGDMGVGVGGRGRERGRRLPFGLSSLPKVNFRCDPLINFKFKQRLVLLGACVTLGMDYLSDLQQWRSYCAIEDSWVQGRFSLRGSELGWAKSWMLNLGLGEEQAAKFKLRVGVNLKSYKAYAKLRFRTEPMSPFDIGEGISCAGKVPLPVYMLPLLRSIPLRIEYVLRINTARPNTQALRRDPDKKIYLTTGIGTVDLSLDELNFCLEWDEKSPVWGVGIVRTPASRKGGPSVQLGTKPKPPPQRTMGGMGSGGSMGIGGMGNRGGMGGGSRYGGYE
ncbi:hypothetical protein B484DRAFT_417654 [Ochromonadaceae sp. CCMP2298]|nr:hypothetical protein B484DRAFT_417654 [Ochromonadaceae sp. CCMP2298]